eukprot:jgi/Mesvir1/27550/Mv07304-RA.1
MLLPFAAFLLLTASLCGCATDKPNIIVLLADDLGYGDVGFLGSPSILTPNMDRLAYEGMRFTDWYAGSSMCSPSRAAMLTGRYGVRSRTYPTVYWCDAGAGLPANETTVAEMLQGVGYDTAYVGKWHLGTLPEYMPTAHGFDQYYGVPYSIDMGSLEGHPRQLDNDCPYIPLMDGNTVLQQPVDYEHVEINYAAYAANYIRQHQANREGPGVGAFSSAPGKGVQWGEERAIPRWPSDTSTGPGVCACSSSSKVGNAADPAQVPGANVSWVAPAGTAANNWADPKGSTGGVNHTGKQEVGVAASSAASEDASASIRQSDLTASHLGLDVGVGATSTGESRGANVVNSTAPRGGLDVSTDPSPNPYFLVVAFNHVHISVESIQQYSSPAFKGRSRRGRFGDALMEMDWAVGQIMAALDEDPGTSRNTLVLLTSDNGPWTASWIRDNGGSMGPFFGWYNCRTTGNCDSGKCSNWEGGWRVPAIARWPGRIRPGSICESLVGSTDLLPTLATLAGAPLPQGVRLDGIDISGIMLNEPVAAGPGSNLTEARSLARTPGDRWAAAQGVGDLRGPGRGPWGPGSAFLKGSRAVKVDRERSNSSSVTTMVAPQGGHEFFFYWRVQNPIHVGAVRHGSWKAHFITQPGALNAPHIYHDPPLLFNVEYDPSERFDLDVTRPVHATVVATIKNALALHKAEIQAELGPIPLQGGLTLNHRRDAVICKYKDPQDFSRCFYPVTKRAPLLKNSGRPLWSRPSCAVLVLAMLSWMLAWYL